MTRVMVFTASLLCLPAFYASAQDAMGTGVSSTVYKAEAVTSSIATPAAPMVGASPSASQAKPTVAVLDFSANNASASDAAMVSELIRTAVVRTGKYSVIEKNNMNMVLAEQAFQRTGCTDETCAVKLGKVLNARKVIVGSYGMLEGNRLINARLVDVETGKIDSSESLRVDKVENVDRAVGDLVAKLTGANAALPAVVAAPATVAPLSLPSTPSVEAPRPAVHPEVVVKATRMGSPLTDLPTNVSVIGRDEIGRSNALTAADVLKSAVGITEVSDRGTRGSDRDLRIRSGGDTASQVLVLLDGQPVNDVSLGSANLGEFPAENIERIEVIRGPSSALWGANALGGVVNIVTREPVKEGASAKVTALGGSFGNQDYRVSADGKADGKRFAFSAARDESRGWRENSGYRCNDFSMNGGWNMAGWGDLGMRLAWYQSAFGLPGQNTTPIGEYDGEKERRAQSPDASMSTVKRYGQIEYSRRIFSDTKATVRTYGSLNEKEYEWPSALTDDLSTDYSGGIGVQMETPRWGVAGADHRQDFFIRKNKTVTPADRVVDERLVNNAVFVQKAVKWSGLNCILGGRYDHNSEFGGQVNPRLAVAYTPVPALKVSGNVGRAFRAPTFEDLYSPYSSWPASAWGLAGDTGGNPGLKPERAWGYDCGMEARLGSALVARITAFRSDVWDMIAWDDVDPNPNYGKWRPSNVGRAFNRGIEVETGHEVIRGLEHGANYTYLESKGKQEGQDRYKTLMYSPRHRAGYRLDYKHKIGLKTGARVNYTHRVRWEDGYGAVHELPGYTVVDVRISQKIALAEVFFAIDNIFERRYQSREGYPLPGRSFTGGMSMTF